MSERKPKKHPEPEVKGKTAPQDPPEKVNMQDQQLLLDTVPANGFMLCRLITPDQRQELGFSPSSKAFQSCALLQALKYSKEDDIVENEIPVGSLFFASVEEIAPILNTYLFLLPVSRIQGSLPSDKVVADLPRGFGFR